MTNGYWLASTSHNYVLVNMIIEMPLQKVSQPIVFYRDHTQYIHTSSGAYVIFQLSKKHQVLTEFY